jgi:hypothetical protein
MDGQHNKSQPLSIQQQLKAQLEQVGLPYKQIECYGSQIVITSHCQDTANKWASVLAKVATVRRAALESRDEAAEQKGTCLNRTYVKVWRTYAVVA